MRKIKHAIGYTLLAAWVGVIICGVSVAFWIGIIQPLIEMGIVNSLLLLGVLISVGILAFFAVWAIEKLIEWLLEE